jgi:hypothetical protein
MVNAMEMQSGRVDRGIFRSCAQFRHVAGHGRFPSGFNSRTLPRSDINVNISTFMTKR